MTTSLQSNGKYLVEPDKRRGELHVVYVSGVSGNGVGGRVKLEWKDRRTKVRYIVCVIVLCFVLLCGLCAYHVRNLHKPALNLYLNIYIYIYIQTTLTHTNKK